MYCSINAATCKAPGGSGQMTWTERAHTSVSSRFLSPSGVHVCAAVLCKCCTCAAEYLLLSKLHDLYAMRVHSAFCCRRWTLRRRSAGYSTAFPTSLMKRFTTLWMLPRETMICVPPCCWKHMRRMSCRWARFWGMGALHAQAAAWTAHVSVLAGSRSVPPWDSVSCCRHSTATAGVLMWSRSVPDAV